MGEIFEFAKRPCFVCNSVKCDMVLLGKSLADASDFRNTSEPSTEFCYGIATCRFCGHNSIRTNNPCLLPTRKHDFIKYGEPTEHYSLISKVLKTLDINFNDTSIHTFSYKDFKLANFLSAQLDINNVYLNDWLGCSDDWLPTTSTQVSGKDPKPLTKFFAEINNSEKTHKIVLITRFFDHVASEELLKKMIGIASATVHIIFDLNDYDELFTRGTLEFIWNERRNLLHKNHLEHVLTREGQRFSIFAYESSEVSPTVTGLISHLLPRSEKVLKAKAPEKINHNLGHRLKSLRKRWHEDLTNNHKLGIIGASHKGISLAQFILAARTTYSLHDDKESLKCKVPPVLAPLGFHSVSGFDFSGYTHIAITTTLSIASKIIPKLRASGFTGEILDFDCKKLN